MISGSSASNSSIAWMYTENNPSVNGDYDEVMKYFVFVYFVGRPYGNSISDSAIACLSIYNTTVGPNTTTITMTTTTSNNIATQLPLSGNLFIFVLLSIIFINIVS
jgi:hypothetical protein